MNEHNSWMMVEMARIYREERIKDAELSRLVRMAQGEFERPQANNLVPRLLYGLGERLAALGLGLEGRYRCAAGMSTYPAGDC